MLGMQVETKNVFELRMMVLDVPGAQQFSLGIYMPQVYCAEVGKVRSIIKIAVTAHCFTKHCNTV